MPRPRKAGLDYYYKGVQEWNDIKIIQLLQKYGPMGHCVYDVVLSKVYESGYYLEMPLDLLAVYVIRTVGNRWIRDKSIAMQVIRYCAEIGLFDNALMQQSVITSASIQQHYDEVTARSKANKCKYWLLGDSDVSESPAEEPDLPENDEFSAKTEVFSEKTPENTAKTPQTKENKTKENKTKSNKSKANKSKADKSKADRRACAEIAAAVPKDEIEEAFLSVSGRRFNRSDLAALEEMRFLGADDSLILHVIRQINLRGTTDITSMRYFLPIVKKALNCGKGFPSTDFAERKPVLIPSTSDSEEVESILDAEWAMQVSMLPPVSEEDYRDYA